MRKEAVASMILAPERLQGYSVRLAYDLGSLKLAVIDRPSDPQALSLVRAGPPAAAPAEDFVRAFRGEPFEGRTHPLELLGYDLVQVKSHGVDPVGDREVPWVEFAWMRQEPDSPIERGSGSAHWLRCPKDSTIVLVGGESEGSDKYDPGKTRTFALAALPCATPSERKDQ
jgi:hypothetical protein